MKCYKLITKREWLELGQLTPKSMFPKNSFIEFPKTLLQESGFKKVRFNYGTALDETIHYCIHSPEQCQQLYLTLEHLGLYHGTNTYGHDNAKVTQALKEALESEQVILLEKPLELDSGLLPPQTHFLRLPSYTVPRKLTVDEIRERELRYYDEENWIELSIDNLPNQPFTLFRSSSQKVVYQGKLDSKGHAYVKLDADIKLVDILFDKQPEYRPWYYDIPLQAVGAVRDATQNSLDLVGEFVQQKTKLNRAEDYFNPLQVLLSFFTRDPSEDLNDVLKKQNTTIHANLDQFANPITLPDIDPPRTITGALTRGITQFLVGYITAYRIIKPITKIGSLVKGAIAGIIADSTVMAANEERLSNLIERDFPELSNSVTGYLQAKPDDSEAEGRFKNALEGLLVGLVAEPFMRSLKLLKYARFKAPIIEVRTKVHYKLEADTIEKNIIKKGIFDKKLNILTPKEMNQLSLDELKQALPEDWKFFEHNGRVHIKDANDNFRIRIDPADEVINYQHMHFFDSNKNLLDINGNIVDRKSIDAHIPWSYK